MDLFVAELAPRMDLLITHHVNVAYLVSKLQKEAHARNAAINAIESARGVGDVW